MHCTTSLLKWIWRLSLGEERPEEVALVGVVPTEPNNDSTPCMSGVALSKEVRSREFSASCALRIAPACFRRVCCDRERCKMVSDAVFFFKIDFFSTSELGVERRLGGGDVLEVVKRFLSVCNGPYNQVTSQSFSLLVVSYIEP